MTRDWWVFLLATFCLPVAGRASLVLISRVLAQDLISLGFSALPDGGWKRELCLFLSLPASCSVLSGIAPSLDTSLPVKSPACKKCCLQRAAWGWWIAAGEGICSWGSGVEPRSLCPYPGGPQLCAGLQGFPVPDGFPTCSG